MNAILAAEFTPTSLNILDLQVDHNLAQTEQILNLVRGMATRYHPSVVVVEKNSFQLGLTNDFRFSRMGSELGFTLRPHLTGAEKHDPIQGVAAMPGSFNAGQIRIPYADEHARTRMQPLLIQLESWRPNVPTRLIKQDAVMALWFAWKHWRAWQETLRIESPHRQRRPSWLTSFKAPALTGRPNYC